MEKKKAKGLKNKRSRIVLAQQLWDSNFREKQVTQRKGGCNKW